LRRLKREGRDIPIGERGTKCHRFKNGEGNPTGYLVEIQPPRLLKKRGGNKDSNADVENEKKPTSRREDIWTG